MSTDAITSTIGLLPTSGITDPHVRKFLDRLKLAWEDTTAGSNRLITTSDFARMATDAVTTIMGGGAQSGVVTPNNSAANSLAMISEAIRATVVYQLLQQTVNVDDLAVVRKSVDDALQQAATGITTETQRRSTETTALASAINRIWSLVGGSTAVISDGALASTNANAAVATKWNTVIAAVTDPNTGNVASASILQETRTYANNTDSTLNALYSVRAQIAAGGQTVVGGFGLAATSGAGSAQGPSIGFGVLANSFFIAAPSTSYDPVAQYGVNTQQPFVVVTTPTTINGVVYQPGVYLKNAVIGTAAIGNAQIGQNIFSSNFDGTFNIAGNLTSFGSTGWAVSKDGSAVFNNIKARGDIQASSLTANSVFTNNINGDQVTVARYVDAYNTAAVNSNLNGYPFMDGGITTSAMNSQGAPIMVDFYAKLGNPAVVGSGGQLWVTFYRDGTALFQGDARDMPHSFSCDAASHTYTMQFGNQQEGVTSRWLKVQSFIR